MSNEDGHKLDLTLRLGFHDEVEDNKEKVEDNTSILESNNQDPLSIRLGQANSNAFVQGNIATMRRSSVDRSCKVCGVNQTPLWRKGPDGPQVNHLP
ncbi:GATA transcription factor 15-like [Olea europaea subsp. europaea]|uniref:GATA transcription factor 15-like n=1 Tax=Olea europaea subsp. europaea TaxID=158383 RepID=A0A8S0QJH1_OLEEU|nr:GATA transcription factor 15-like [Olea europaea subsp. europaea]